MLNTIDDLLLKDNDIVGILTPHSVFHGKLSANLSKDPNLISLVNFTCYAHGIKMYGERIDIRKTDVLLWGDIRN